MLGLLLALAASECFVADDVYRDEDRNETAIAVCKELLNETKLTSYADYMNMVENAKPLTSRSVMFYGNRSLGVDLDKALSLSFEKREVPVEGGDPTTVTVQFPLTVYIACEPGGSVKLIRNRTWFDNLTHSTALNLVIHESVSEVNVWNGYPGIEHRLFVTTLTDYSNCSITAETRTPMLYADRIVMSRNLVQRHTEGSVQLIAYYYVFEVDEEMVDGEVSDLVASYSPAANTSAQQNLGSGRVLQEVQRTLWHKFVFIIRVEANVTMGPLRCEVSTMDGVLALNTYDQFGELIFDLQGNVDVNFFCVDTVEASELLGGTLSHNAFILNGTRAGSVPKEHGGFLFHGKWPYVADLLGKTEVLRIESVMTADRLSVSRTRYVGMRRPMFQYCPGIPLKIVGDNIPVYFKGSDKSMILGSTSVGIQIDIDTNCTIYMCGEDKCALRVKSLDPESPPNITGGDDSGLEIIARTCSKFGNATELKVTCENIDIRQGAARALKGLSLADGGTIFTSYTYPGTFPSLSDLWDRLTGEHTWFVKGGAATTLWNDWNYTLRLIVGNLEQLSREFKIDVMNRFPTVLEELNVLGHAHIYVARQDVIPFASFYSKNPQKIACLSHDVVLQNWSLSISSSPSSTKNGLQIFDKYAPSFRDFDLRDSSLVTLDKKCVGLRMGQSPVSTTNIIVYTSNATYIQILSAFPEYVTIVTPKNVDSEVNLTNPNSKNVAVLFLESIPEGKSVHLGNLRSDANVFAFGIPLPFLHRVFEIVELAYGSREQTYYDQIKDLINPLVANYTQYFPALSITSPRVGCIVLAGANYVGAKIDSEHFYALGCRFERGLSVTSRYTYVDTYSYETLKDVVLNDVVLFPISTATPDHISITNITFTKNKVTMFGTSGHYRFLGQQAGSFEYSVGTENIKGQLQIMSFGNALTFDIDDTAGSQVKGVKVIMDGGFNSGSFHVADFLPASPLLSTDTDMEQEHVDILDRFTSVLRLFAEEETSTRPSIKVAFTGTWDKVKVDGFFGVSAGDAILTLDDVPGNILTNLELNPAFATSVTVSGTPDDIHMGPQVITRLSEVNYDIDPSVTMTFENLTFARGVSCKVRESSLTVLFNYTEKELVANHVKCSDYSLVNLNALSIQESLEMGLVSALSTTKIQTKEIDLTLHYNFASGFPSLRKGQNVAPKSIKLFYDGDDTATNIEAYLSKPLTIKNL